MRLTNLVALFTASASLVTVRGDFTDGSNLPEDHILRAVAPKPVLVGRAATTLVTSTSTQAATDASCTNGASSRNCWSSGYSVATDFDQKWPTTGVTRYYTLTVSNTTCSLDGSPKKQCFLYNGQFPGPLIRANWGDNLVVTVNNNLKSNGTGVHWHGVRMKSTCPMDGVGVSSSRLSLIEQPAELFLRESQNVQLHRATARHTPFRQRNLVSTVVRFIVISDWLTNFSGTSWYIPSSG